MRKRTRISRSKGSRWMSLARSLTACWSSEFTSLMMGASSAASSRSCGSWLMSLARWSRSSAASSASASVELGAAVVDLVDRAQDRALVGQLEAHLGAVEEQAQVVERRRCRAGSATATRTAPSGSRCSGRITCALAKPIGTARSGVWSTTLAAICGRIGRPELGRQRLQHLVGADLAARDQQVGQAAAAGSPARRAPRRAAPP